MSRPWYREPWPWLLLAPPVASILMGIATWTLAALGDDGLVADDYYRQGLAVNRTLERQARAAELGVRGDLTFNPERTRVRLRLATEGGRPASATLRLVHATRAGRDQVVTLSALRDGTFEGMLAPPPPGRWRVVVEDAAGGWRVSTEWDGREPAIALEPLRRPWSAR